MLSGSGDLNWICIIWFKTWGSVKKKKKSRHESHPVNSLRQHSKMMVYNVCGFTQMPSSRIILFWPIKKTGLILFKFNSSWNLSEKNFWNWTKILHPVLCFLDLRFKKTSVFTQNLKHCFFFPFKSVNRKLNILFFEDLLSVQKWKTSENGKIYRIWKGKKQKETLKPIHFSKSVWLPFDRSS